MAKEEIFVITKICVTLKHHTPRNHSPHLHSIVQLHHQRHVVVILTARHIMHSRPAMHGTPPVHIHHLSSRHGREHDERIMLRHPRHREDISQTGSVETTGEAIKRMVISQRKELLRLINHTANPRQRSITHVKGSTDNGLLTPPR